MARPSQYGERPVRWRKTGDVHFPYSAEVEGQTWRVRLNDFPAEPIYTLLIDGREVETLEEWPVVWERP